MGHPPRLLQNQSESCDTIGGMAEDKKATLSGRLAGITLPDSDGNAVRLGSLWESAPAVVVFLRHYG